MTLHYKTMLLATEQQEVDTKGLNKMDDEAGIPDESWETPPKPNVNDVS